MKIKVADQVPQYLRLLSMHCLLFVLIIVSASACTCGDDDWYILNKSRICEKPDFMYDSEYYTMAYDNCDVYMFGGATYRYPYYIFHNKLYLVDACSGSYVLLDEGTGPSGRLISSSSELKMGIVYVIDNCFIIYGGIDFLINDEYIIKQYRDLWIWNLLSKKWSLVYEGRPKIYNFLDFYKKS